MPQEVQLDLAKFAEHTNEQTGTATAQPIALQDVTLLSGRRQQAAAPQEVELDQAKLRSRLKRRREAAAAKSQEESQGSKRRCFTAASLQVGDCKPAAIGCMQLYNILLCHIKKV